MTVSFGQISIVKYFIIRFNHWNSLNFGIPLALVSLLEVYYKLDRLLIALSSNKVKYLLFDDVQIKHNFLRGVPEKNVLL